MNMPCKIVSSIIWMLSKLMALRIFLPHVSLKKFCETIILTELNTVYSYCKWSLRHLICISLNLAQNRSKLLHGLSWIETEQISLFKLSILTVSIIDGLTKSLRLVLLKVVQSPCFSSPLQYCKNFSLRTYNQEYVDTTRDCVPLAVNKFSYKRGKKVRSMHSCSPLIYSNTGWDLSRID